MGGPPSGTVVAAGEVTLLALSDTGPTTVSDVIRRRVLASLPRRLALSLLAVPVLMSSLFVGAGPAVAAEPGWRGTGMTLLQVLGVFLGLPLGLFIVISLIFVLLPSWAREVRYRPGLVWTAEPVWFDGPETRSDQASGAAEPPARPTTDGGGASASW